MTFLHCPQYADAMQLSAMVLDIYDDPQARVLTQKLAGRPLPEKLASAALLSATELASLPDRLFALVAENAGQPVRKYAMHDEAHLVTSLLYFCEKGEQLPLEAQKFAAERLVEACTWYGVTPPEKVAGLLGTAVNVAGGAMDALNVKNVAQQGMQKHRQTMAGMVGKVGSVLEELPTEDRLPAKTESTMTAEQERKAVSHYGPLDLTPRDAKKTLPFTLDEDTKTQRTGKLPAGIEAVVDAYVGDALKKADLRGSDVMPMAGDLPGVTTRTPIAKAVKKAAVDLTSFDGHVAQVRAKHSSFAMPHLQKYPIDTAEQVKRASAYFSEHCGEFDPAERRIFAQSVWRGAQEHGVKLAGAILDYAGSGYGPHFEDQLRVRIHHFEGTGHETIYETLLEKKAELDPAVAAQILSEADEATGANLAYGRLGMNLLDAQRAVFGSAKLAAEQDSKDVQDTNYTWKDGTEYVTGLQLKNFAAHGPQQITMPFGDELARKFFADPVTTFKGLTDPQKKLMARILNSHSVAGAGHA